MLVVGATRVAAQEVISNPGHCAFFILTRIARTKALITPTLIQIIPAVPGNMREPGRAVKSSASPLDTRTAQQSSTGRGDH
jgi:hypothetical protein